MKSFYRPHKRVTFDNTAPDPKTGKPVRIPSMTKQEFQAECDINNVIKQFKPHHMQQMLAANLASGMYEDLPDPVDYQEALDLVRAADREFMTIPSKVRERFGHDPRAFLAFSSDPANLDELRSLGLAKPAVAPAAPVEVIIKGPAQDDKPPPKA